MIGDSKRANNAIVDMFHNTIINDSDAMGLSIKPRSSMINAVTQTPMKLAFSPYKLPSLGIVAHYEYGQNGSEKY